MVHAPVILQTSETDCGPAAVASLLRTQHRRVQLADIRTEMDPGRDGASGLVLRDAAEQWGVRLKAFLASPEQLAENIDQLGVPFILHLSRQHYVVVDRITRRGVRVMDPAVGRRTLSRQELAEQASGMMLVIDQVHPDDQFTAPEPSQRRHLHIVREVLRSVRADLGRAAFFSALLAVGGLALPMATALIVDSMVADSLERNRWLMIGLGLAAVMGLLSLARYWILATLQQRLAGKLSDSVASTLFTRRLQFFERRSIGDLASRVESAHAIHNLLGVTLLGAALDAILVTGYIVALAVAAPQLAVSTSVIIACCLGVSFWVAARCAALRREEILLAADSSTLLVDSISGIATLRVYGSDAGALDEWQDLLHRRLLITRSRTRLNALSLALLAAMTVATPLLILIQASSASGTGMFSTITPGTALGLMALAGAALAPVTSLATQLVSAADLRPLLERIDDLEVADTESTGELDPGVLNGEIALDNLSFKHERHGAEVLQELNGRIRAGSKLVILGPTGCGKSTLVSLLTGLHTPTRGAVLFDGKDLTELNLAAVRNQIGVVFQDNWLGSGTIREAVLAHREGYDDKVVWQALAKAQIAPEIAAMPLGLETRLGSGGSGFSGGQRQRLALARALLANPRILILDEPTSALDAGTETQIEQVLERLDITRIVITHRLTTAANADQVWVMQQGRIVESGTPAELASGQGWFAQLQGRQLEV